jgi:hypothetical protein
MNDREITELAAKAAGIVGVWHERGQCIHATNCAGLSDMWWRPLEDDGDALRLAVKLKLMLGFHNYENSVRVISQDLLDPVHTEPVGDDPYAAARRAIVRAAAEIGKHAE